MKTCEGPMNDRCLHIADIVAISSNRPFLHAMWEHTVLVYMWDLCVSVPTTSPLTRSPVAAGSAEASCSWSGPAAVRAAGRGHGPPYPCFSVCLPVKQDSVGVCVWGGFPPLFCSISGTGSEQTSTHPPTRHLHTYLCSVSLTVQTSIALVWVWNSQFWIKDKLLMSLPNCAISGRITDRET